MYTLKGHVRTTTIGVVTPGGGSDRALPGAHGRAPPPNPYYKYVLKYVLVLFYNQIGRARAVLQLKRTCAYHRCCHIWSQP